jgi:hypothetical protein
VPETLLLEGKRDIQEMGRANPTDKLNLLAGELVEVRSREEILATLDENGRLEAMPFMPEMLQFCGKRFRVFKRAHKTCDNIQPWNMRSVKDAVHLTGVRCTGEAHGSCDAGCLIFWKEAWLKRIDPSFLDEARVSEGGSAASKSNGASLNGSKDCTVDGLQKATQNGTDPASGEVLYRCQATDLREFTSNLPWWNLWQYVRDIRSGNLRRAVAGDSKSERSLEALLGWLEVFRSILIESFNKFQSARNSVQYPHIEGSLATTPTEELYLQPGEFAQVKSREEILATLDLRNRNRGLLFDSEMLRYCGGTYRVIKRVHQIVDEKTGKTLRMKSPCIILEGSACVSEYHRHCPRAIYHYWREAWLRRVE